nr:hypothetical protein Iba_chr04aCG18300 [Ipomoea batatas]
MGKPKSIGIYKYLFKTGSSSNRGTKRALDANEGSVNTNSINSSTFLIHAVRKRIFQTLPRANIPIAPRRETHDEEVTSVLPTEDILDTCSSYLDEEVNPDYNNEKLKKDFYELRQWINKNLEKEAKGKKGSLDNPVAEDALNLHKFTMSAIVMVEQQKYPTLLRHSKPKLYTSCLLDRKVTVPRMMCKVSVKSKLLWQLFVSANEVVYTARKFLLHLLESAGFVTPCCVEVSASRSLHRHSM